MLKVTVFWVSFVCSAVAIAADIPAVNYLVYGTAGEPLQVVQGDGEVGGFITDVVTEVFAGSGVAVVPVIKPITRQKPNMINGKAKRWIAYALGSWRQEGVWGDATFAGVDLIPYSLSLGYKKRAPEPEVMNLTESLLAGGVVWIRGFKYPGTEAFSQRYHFNFDRAKNHTAMLNMVAAGHTRFFMEHEPRMRYIMAKQGMKADDFSFYSLKSEVPPTSITLLMSNDLGAETIALVNRRLAEMQGSGRIAELTEAYGL